MRIGGRERGKLDQEEDRGWVYRNCGGERVSVCGIGSWPDYSRKRITLKADVWNYILASAFSKSNRK